MYLLICQVVVIATTSSDTLPLHRCHYSRSRGKLNFLLCYSKYA
jgi:hypothetical protein